MTQAKGLHIYADDSILCNRHLLPGFNALHGDNPPDTHRKEAWNHEKIYLATDSAGFPDFVRDYGHRLLPHAFGPRRPRFGHCRS
ncbi:hypothetical protein SDC9_155947 [bioreactor metagenome]|uniref:Uncharacterized protein n=1 Tax=bioreactor metagenome TaxID=1076179 RepID=A0A645F571_9ZZZZ